MNLISVASATTIEDILLSFVCNLWCLLLIYSYSVWICDDVRGRLSAGPIVCTYQQHPGTSHRCYQLCGELPQTSSRAVAGNWSVVWNSSNDELDSCLGELIRNCFHF